jgi:hypothetical protein
VFTTSDGQPLHPDYLTRRFRFLVEQSGLPPVRLHDHAAASHQTHRADLFSTLLDRVDHNTAS